MSGGMIDMGTSVHYIAGVQTLEGQDGLHRQTLATHCESSRKVYALPEAGSLSRVIVAVAFCFLGHLC